MTDILDLPTFHNYVASAAQTTFSFSFRAFDYEYVEVEVDGVLATYSPTPLTSAQFSITGDPAEDGGSVVFGAGLAAGAAVLIVRRLPLERRTAFPATGPVPNSALNLEYDRQVSIMQDLARENARALRTELGEDGPILAPLSTMTGKVLAYDGEKIVGGEIDLAALQAAASAAQTAKTEAEQARDDAQESEEEADAARDETVAAAAGIADNVGFAQDAVTSALALVDGATSLAAIAYSLALHHQDEIVFLKQRLAEVARGGIAAWALAARVRNHGWTLEIDVAETNAGGTFDPSKLRLISYDWGFNENCQLCVRPRSIEITRAMRKPGGTTAYEDIAAGVATWRLSLSEQMFAKAKANTGGMTVNSGFDPILYLAEGWYADGGVDAPDQDGIRVQNNSTEAYPLVAVRNFTPPFRLLGASGKFEVSGNSVHATEGRVYAAARCDLTGQTSGVVRSQIVKEMIESDFYPKRTNALPVFQANFDMTAFTQNEAVTERWRLYPWIGDVPTDSNDGNFEVLEFATHTHWVNHAGTFPKVYAVIDATSGNDETGAASIVSEAAAAATPFATDKAALYAAWLLNQSQHGRSSQAGIELCFSDETHTLTLLKSVFGSGSLTFFDAAEVSKAGTWCVYRPVTGATNCVIERDTGSNLRTVPRRTVFRGFAGLDLVGVAGGTPIFLDGGEANDGSYGQEIWIDGVPMIDAVGLTSTVIGLYRCGKIWMCNCDQPVVGVNTYGFSNLRHNYALVRDTDVPGPAHPGSGGTCPAFGGCAFGEVVLRGERPAANTNFWALDNIVVVGFSARHTATGSAGYRAADQMEITRFGMLNVLIESYGASNNQPAMFIGGDGSNIRIRNFFADYLTVVGNRLNSGYEDTFVMTDDGDGEQQLKKLFVFRRAIFYEINTKHDLFGTVNAAKIHAWNHAHRVGWKYVRVMVPSSAGQTAPGNGSWMGEAWPSTIEYVGPDARAQFEDYRANHGATVGAGNGDYTPAAGSIFLGVIPLNDEACSIDLIGNARNGAVGALERV